MFEEKHNFLQILFLSAIVIVKLIKLMKAKLAAIVNKCQTCIKTLKQKLKQRDKIPHKHTMDIHSFKFGNYVNQNIRALV